ncbi:hypothetical protein F3157_10100 [Virgibacillus dakarensis]|uniref:Uncharacterized protein n=1 Tax=Lentibacillus populi TaxID=1827502 RepID=A0A9W5U0P1_9BACI|nr:MULTISPECIES: hypothetical protein [Bacillaceae]MBT2215558.1 hypothetical protein [Virgibacillus dakarensis]MTW86007.1 hypothetical protein [Virgibacillus dakarensis]GGB56541.1 hypothetical protein GCM10011409_37660 [Lentibacillus populi]
MPTKKITNNCKIGQLTYSKESNEFQSAPEANSDIILLLGYINIRFNSETETATQVWGFHHNFNWIERKIVSPNASKGILRLNLDLDPGDTKRLNQPNEWNTYYDRESGWICFGNPENSSRDNSVEFFTNTIVTLSNTGEIESLWLKPEFIE